MSLHPQPWPEPSGEITRAVLAIYAGKRAPMPIAARDELGEVFADAQFASAFAECGPEGWSPGRLMLVTVLQAAEGLTDRAELVTRIASLEESARKLATERDARSAEASHAQQRIAELEDELTAARESLRRAIRQANR